MLDRHAADAKAYVPSGFWLTALEAWIGVLSWLILSSAGWTSRSCPNHDQEEEGREEKDEEPFP
jgi:hypothetical protein